jgi:hypothetical protein
MSTYLRIFCTFLMIFREEHQVWIETLRPLPRIQTLRAAHCLPRRTGNRKGSSSHFVNGLYCNSS